MAKFEIKRNVLVFPDKEKSEKGTENVFREVAEGVEKYYNYDAKLRVRIRWAKNVLNFNLGERVELAKWATGAQRCNIGTSHGKKKRTAKEINAKIERQTKLIDEIFEEFERKNITPTIEELRNAYNNIETKGTAFVEKSIFDYFDEFVSKQSEENNWKASTLEKFSAIKNHFKAFDKDLTFDRFNKDGLRDYVGYLRDTKQMRNSTILKQIAFLKWFLKWALKEGYNTNNTFATFAPKMEKGKKKVIFLDWSELMTVYNFDFQKGKKTLSDGSQIDLDDENKKALERVRDVFCFCCFTSLRYSDVENLKRTDIVGDIISITTIKTDDSLKIELNDYSRAILAKYADKVYPSNKALPVISNAKMNIHLKDLGEICGLKTPTTITYFKGSQRYDEVYPKHELLSSHCGRRTFICNALTLGIAPQTVMKWTGHTDYNSMKPYIDIADTEKKKAMELYNT